MMENRSPFTSTAGRTQRPYGQRPHHDPFLNALAEHQRTYAKWMPHLSAYNCAEKKILEEVPRPTISYAGRSNKVYSRQSVHEFFRGVASTPEALEAQAAALRTVSAWKKARDEVALREKLKAKEAVANKWCSKNAAALTRAFETQPTTVAGLRAYVDLMVEEYDMFWPTEGADALRAAVHKLTGQAAETAHSRPLGPGSLSQT